MSRRARIILKSAVWGACLSPLVVLLYQFHTDNLGANPIDYVTRTLGVWTLRILLASLAMTPLRLLFGISWPITLRRLLGLFAFFYVCLHFAVWIVVDHFFDWEQLIADILKRPYITVGMLALTLLLPLAATSTTGMVKRLGGRNWRRLHRLVYVVGILGVLHFLWLAKKGVNDPYWYAAALGLLLGVRLWDWARRSTRFAVTRRTVPAVSLFALVALGAMVWLASGSYAQRAPRLGQRAPEITGGPWVNSAPLSLETLRGRVVFVEFWTYG